MPGEHKIIKLEKATKPGPPDPKIPDRIPAGSYNMNYEPEYPAEDHSPSQAHLGSKQRSLGGSAQSMPPEADAPPSVEYSDTRDTYRENNSELYGEGGRTSRYK